MPTPSLGYDLKSPLPSLGQLYSALEGREHLKGQLEVMFKKRTLNWIDLLPRSRFNNFIHIFLYNMISWFIESFFFSSFIFY